MPCTTAEVRSNAIAARVMEEAGDPVSNRHAHVSAIIDTGKPAAHGAVLFHFDKQPIHPPVVAAIRRAPAQPDPKYPKNPN